MQVRDERRVLIQRSLVQHFAHFRAGEDRLQHPATDGETFVRDHLAETRVVAGVHVTDLHAAGNSEAGVEEASEDAGEGRDDWGLRIEDWGLRIGDWGLRIGDWGLRIGGWGMGIGD